jgi:peptidyl-tRNA hydrolase, PTH1 family
MKVIFGLGNPGRQYERTRHNVGWWVVDHLADVWHLGRWRSEGGALSVSGRLGAAHVRLVKPTTFMNLSGDALIPFLKRPAWHAASDLLVVVDEVAIPVGTWRLRAEGSSGGHNGLKSIERQVGSREYARLRVGIRPLIIERLAVPLEDFVLSPFAAAEREATLALLPRLVEVAERWVRDGVTAAMHVAASSPTQGN